MTGQEQRDAVHAVMIGWSSLGWVKQWCRRLNTEERRECIGALLRAGAGQYVISFWQDTCEQVDGDDNER